jgi:hypothetical protein
MSATERAAVWVRLGRRLGLANRTDADDAGRPAMPDLIGAPTFDEISRRIQGPRVEPDLDPPAVADAMTRCVGQGTITADGLTWLARRSTQLPIPDPATLGVIPPTASAVPGAAEHAASDDRPSAPPARASRTAPSPGRSRRSRTRDR